MSAYHEIKTVDKDFPVRIQLSKKSDFPPHYHKVLEVLLVKKGSIIIEVNHVRHTLQEGDLFIVGSNHIHSYVPEDKGSQAPAFYMLIFDWNHLASLYTDKELFGHMYPVLLKSRHYSAKSLTSANLLPLLEDIMTESQEKKTGYKLAIMSCLYRFLIVMTRLNIHEPFTDSDLKALKKEHQFITKVNDYIYANYTSELPLEGIAEATGYSIYHFTRLFKKYVGTTYKDYLTNFRINMVKEDLYDDTYSITEAAFRNGFSSIITFNRCFRSRTGMTPSDYKKAIND